MMWCIKGQHMVHTQLPQHRVRLGARARVPIGSSEACLGAFTLVELLIAVAIIVTLIAVLMPALRLARAQARTLQCMSNLRQVCLAMTAYAADHRGRFPPSVTTGRPTFWYDQERCGRYLMVGKYGQPGSVRGPVVTCPEDENGVRSYAMNVWASSAVDGKARGAIGTLGVLWRNGAPGASRVILVVESFSIYGIMHEAWACGPTVGIVGGWPGRRFGGNGGLSPMKPNVRYDYLRCELPYYRHRLGSDPNLTPTDPKGRIAIGYVDGHVALKSDGELVRADGTSTLDSLWSTIDPAINFVD